MLEITGSGTLFATMLSVVVLPRLLLGPVAGVTADRVRRIRLMSGVLFGEAALLAAYMILGRWETLSVTLICILVVLMECVEIFYNASASAVLPELVPPEQLKSAIAVSKVDDGIVVVACPMIAALIYSHVPIAGALGIVALINLMAGLLQCFIRPKYETKREKAASQSFWQNFREGVAFAKQDAFIRAMLLSLPLCNAFFWSGIFCRCNVLIPTGI